MPTILLVVSDYLPVGEYAFLAHMRLEPEGRRVVAIATATVHTRPSGDSVGLMVVLVLPHVSSRGAGQRVECESLHAVQGC